MDALDNAAADNITALTDRAQSYLANEGGVAQLEKLAAALKQ
jgi:hypothetical protein